MFVLTYVAVRSIHRERLASPEVADGLSRASGIPKGNLAQLAITDHEASLRADLDRLAASPYVPPGSRVSGLRYDQMTGRAQVVFTETLS